MTVEYVTRTVSRVWDWVIMTLVLRVSPLMLGLLVGGCLLLAPLVAGCVPPDAPARESRVQTTLSSKDGYAQCPAGTTVVGGGFDIDESKQLPDRMPVVVKSAPQNNGWFVQCTDSKGVLTSGCHAWVVCASILRD